MTDQQQDTAQQQTQQPSQQLRELGARMAGTWQIAGGANGVTSFDWFDGGFFLVQRGRMTHDEDTFTMTEFIGHEHAFGTEPSTEIKSWVFDSHGNTLSYVWELDQDTLTIWGGYVGSPAYFRGRFSADGATLAGDWVWPGGGYQATMTRVAA